MVGPRVRTAGSGRQGFSLVEALIALALSGVILALASTVFVAQSTFYRNVTERSKLQESVRAATELVAADVRALTEGSVITATADRLVARIPVVVGVACGSLGVDRYTYVALNGDPVTDGDKSGVGVLEGNGNWAYYTRAWAQLYGGSAEAATITSCSGVGVDTAGPKSDFVRLTLPGAEGGSAMIAGRPIMLYAETVIRFANSDLQPGRLALFRGVDPNLIEFATGFSSDSRFEYRANGAWHAAVTGAQLLEIDAVRVFIEATSEDVGSGPADLGWSVEVPLRNVAGAFGVAP
jgi:prepilin-type N-terminal cleavage/methylation domain-containing protein